MQQQPSHDALSVDSQDVDTQLAAAGSVVRARYTYPYQMHGSIGASCAVADVSRTGPRYGRRRNRLIPHGALLPSCWVCRPTAYV